MNQRYFIGVDVSKAKLDICTVNQGTEVLLEKIIINKQSRIVAYLGALIKRLSKDGSEVLICCEHTGIYTRPLELACEQLGAALWQAQSFGERPTNRMPSVLPSMPVATEIRHVFTSPYPRSLSE